MPSKKKKYNARFPAGRIKKIMQTDEDVGKVAQAVPIMISRTLELFVESLLTKTAQITQSRSAKTLTPSHMKHCILSEHRFDFLKDLVKNIPDASAQEDNENNALFDGRNDPAAAELAASNSNNETQEMQHTRRSSRLLEQPSSSSPPSPSSNNRAPVIQYGPSVVPQDPPNTVNYSVVSLLEEKNEEDDSVKLDEGNDTIHIVAPPLLPGFYKQAHEDLNLCIDEDYDN